MKLPPKPESGTRRAIQEARKKTKERTKEAQKRNKIMDGIPLKLKKTAMDDYFQWRQHQDPELVRITREAEAQTTEACSWCLKFLEAGYMHCPHCGKSFDKTLLRGPQGSPHPS